MKDSRQFETYSQVTEEEMNEQILDEYGLADGETETHRPELDRCPQCQTTFQGEPRFCPGCGLALTHGAAKSLEEAEDDLFEDIAEATDEDEIGMLRDLRNLVKNDPEAFDALSDKDE